MSMAKHDARRISEDRFAMLNEFVDLGMRNLEPSEALVWTALFRDARGGIATTSHNHIRLRTGLGRSTVAKAIPALIQKRFIERLKEGRKDHSPATYRIFAVPYPIDEPERGDA